MSNVYNQPQGTCLIVERHSMCTVCVYGSIDFAAPPGTAEQQGGYMAAPPPAAYPMKDQVSPGNTQSKGDGFWKGW